MRMKLETRVGLGFAVSIAALLVIFFAFNVARAESSRVHDNFIPSINAAKRLLVQLERMENAEFLYFAPGQQANLWMGRFDEADRKFQDALIGAEDVATSRREREIYADLGRHYGAFLHIDKRMRDLLQAGKVSEAKRLNETESLDVAAQVRENAQAFYDFNLEESQRARDAQDQAMLMTEWGALSIVFLGALGAGLLWRRSSRDLVGPVQAIKRSTELLAQGRLEEAHHPAATKTLELAALQSAFNRMGSQLNELTERLRAANVSLESQVAERTHALTQANRQLEQAVEELRALDQVKSNFMAVMSHELLTPINFISGFASALEDELLGPLNPKQQEAMAKILEGAERLTRMVRNTLDYTQLESGKLLVVPEPVEYAALIECMVERLRPDAEAKHLVLKLSLPEELPSVWADPNRVEQLLAELLDNAVKFTSPGGRIRLSVWATPEAITTEVADTGIGIPPKAIEHLHKGFYQADFSSTRHYGGMGLGLAIAYGLIALMGGTMLVQSRLGQGTTFQFTLPRSDVATVPPEARSEHADTQSER